MDQIKEVVTHWVKVCEAGRKAWHDSVGDFNIGDLANVDANDLSDFFSYLKEKGIDVEDIAVHSMDNAPGRYDFDTVLVSVGSL